MNETISAMNDPKIILDQTDEETLLWEVSDEELEACFRYGQSSYYNSLPRVLLLRLPSHKSRCLAFA